jgi:hypothetical protein
MQFHCSPVDDQGRELNFTAAAVEAQRNAHVEAMADKLAAPVTFVYGITMVTLFGFTLMWIQLRHASRSICEEWRSRIKIAEIEYSNDNDHDNREE